LLPRASQRWLIVGVATLATAISLAVNLTRYQQFLLLLGAFFVPLFGVLLADWLLAGRHYTREHIFGGPAWRPGMIAAWLVGFALYEWIAQTEGLGFWSSWLAHLHPPSGGIGASLPSFAVSFVLAAGVAAAARTRRPQHAPA
jgi:purine-cytosine permease-like protein